MEKSELQESDFKLATTCPRNIQNSEYSDKLITDFRRDSVNLNNLIINDSQKYKLFETYKNTTH